MDKIAKALKKLSDSEKDQFKELLIKIEANNLKNLDVKKLKGYDEIFRVRKGKMRVIFRKTDNEIFVLAIEKRSDTIYNL